MKKTLMAIARPICRMTAGFLWQLIWLAPVYLFCWWGKMHFPHAIRTHFGLEQAQDRLTSLERFSEVMKNNVSLSNPAALGSYLSTQLSKFSMAAKLNTLEMTSGLTESLCVWWLNLLWIVAVIYAVIRTFRYYRAEKATYDAAQAVSHQLQPAFYALQQEIIALRLELAQLKEEKLCTKEKVPKALPKK